MAKDPAFLFYYDRFLSGTISMTDSEVGQYIRLMCIQANKGHVTEKDLFHISKTLVNEVTLKFAPIGGGKFANIILTEILAERKSFTESRRNNRKGKNKKQVNNTSETLVELVVNVNKDKDVNNKEIEFDRNFSIAFDPITIQKYQMTFKVANVSDELKEFRVRCDMAPEDYYQRDSAGLRAAFQYQLKNIKHDNKRPNQGASTTISTFSGNYPEGL